MKRIIFLIIIFLLLSPIVLAQRELEIDYPTIPGVETIPKTVEGTSLPAYVKYIFNFAIGIAGLFALGALIYGGMRYLTSAGNPAVMEDAKSQIFAGVLGLIILLSSYLILTTINPQLVVFEVSGLKKVEIGPPPSLQPTEPVSPDPLVRIKALAQTIDKVSLNLKNKGDELKTEMEKCECQNSNSECYCSGLSCIAKRCFEDPCLNREEIKIKQREVIAKTDEILYYKNRIHSEKEDIGPELEQFQRWGRLSEAQCNDLMENLESLILSIESITASSKDFTELPNDCLPETCTANCQRDTCHHSCKGCSSCNGITGCYSEKCTGGTPCPPFNDKVQEIENLQLEITQTSQSIISILD